MRSRVIELLEARGGGPGGPGLDARGLGPSPAPPRATGFVLTHWAAIHAGLASRPDPGVAVVAIDTQRDQVRGSLWLAADPTAINVGIIGRHGCCDLHLDGDAAVSLRHLVLVMEPSGAGAEPRYRLIDLRTGLAFADEEGRALAAATAQGPAFVTVGRYLLLCFPTGGTPWPREVVDLVGRLPQRAHLDERDAAPARSRLASGRVATGTARPPLDALPTKMTFATMFTAVAGPAPVSAEPPGAGEALAGELVIASMVGRDQIRVGLAAVSRGLLLGRYHLCDAGGTRSLALERISRIHALLLMVAGQVWIIDAGSTNGLAVGGRAVKLHRLEDGDTVELADVATARWRCVLDDAAF